jgi:vitamin B12 transporter
MVRVERSWCVWLVSVMVVLVQGMSTVGRAEEPPPSGLGEPVRAPMVVVSATKTPLPLSHVTSAVEVITEEDLKRRQIKTVVDALRLSQGLAVFSNGGPGTQATVRIRGSNADQVLVFIDGAIMNSATLGSFNFANLTTDNIERIEILRGAQSMLWGSDAMGGVINIVTKKGMGKPTVSGFAEYGSFSSIREGVQVTGQQGPVDISASVSRWDFAGFSALNYRRGAAERDGFHNWQASTRIGLTLPRDGRLDVTFRLLQGKVNIDNPPRFDVLGSFNASQQFVYGASYEQPITKWWNQSLTLTRQTESLEFDPGTRQRNVLTGATSTPFGSRSEINTLAHRIEWQHNFQVAKPLLLTAGYQFREQQGENINLTTNTTTIPNKILVSHAGFAQAQLNVADRLFATAGVRIDDYNVFGTATTYRVTGGYLVRETGTKLRGSVGTGFRAPTINQLFFPGFGTPNLKPEKSQSFDVGVDQSLVSDRLTVSGGYFWNRFREMIVSVQSAALCGIGPFGPNFCAQNVGLVGAKGWEASLTAVLVKDRPGVKRLDLQAQYTNILTRDLKERVGNRAPRMPVDQWSLIVGYQPIEPVRVTLEGRYVGSRFDDAGNTLPLRAFEVWNLTANYQVTPKVQAYLRAENLFNEKYEELFGFGTAVQSVYAGLRVSY